MADRASAALGGIHEDQSANGSCALGLCLSGGLASVRLAQAADMKTLRLITSVGKPSVTWTTCDVLRPALQEALKEEVALQAVTGNDGLDAMHEILQVGARKCAFTAPRSWPRNMQVGPSRNSASRI
jgi:hypothetical protein